MACGVACGVAAGWQRGGSGVAARWQRGGVWGRRVDWPAMKSGGEAGAARWSGPDSFCFWCDQCWPDETGPGILRRVSPISES